MVARRARYEAVHSGFGIPTRCDGRSASASRSASAVPALDAGAAPLGAKRSRSSTQLTEGPGLKQRAQVQITL